MEHHLYPMAAIVHSPAFESGICKILQGNESLDIEEQNALCSFKSEIDIGEEDNSFAEQVLKKQRLYNSYQNLQHITPTSNIAERFFSVAKLVISDLRKSMLPKNLESILFLKFNREMWDESLLFIAFNEERSNDNLVNII